MAKKILVVDDSAFMRMMLKNILTKHGYEIAGEAQNGEEAVKQYVRTKPDIVMMDIVMPEVDGLQALKEIKKMDQDAKVVVCSSMGQETIVVEAINAGAATFIVKPFHAEKVIQALQALS